MKRILREPLVHFLLIGAALFAAYAWRNSDTGADPDDIVVSAGQIEHLAATFSRTWLRPPTVDELKGLIDDYVQEEVMSREAIKLGLDRDDTVIRRRLRQKMEFVAEDLLVDQDPPDTELAAFLEEHPDRFRTDARFTFQHVYLNPETREDRLQQDATALLATLPEDEPEELANRGDRFLLPHAFTDESRRSIGAQFGEDFAEALADLPIEEWTGPVPSGYGVHLVYVADRTEGRLPELGEIREIVRREWVNDRQDEAFDRYLDGLLRQYDVTIDWPNEGEAPINFSESDTP